MTKAIYESYDGPVCINIEPMWVRLEHKELGPFVRTLVDDMWADIYDPYPEQPLYEANVGCRLPFFQRGAWRAQAVFETQEQAKHWCIHVLKANSGGTIT